MAERGWVVDGAWATPLGQFMGAENACFHTPSQQVKVLDVFSKKNRGRESIFCAGDSDLPLAALDIAEDVEKTTELN
jgi:hypothetical protein